MLSCAMFSVGCATQPQMPCVAAKSPIPANPSRSSLPLSHSLSLGFLACILSCYPPLKSNERLRRIIRQWPTLNAKKCSPTFGSRRSSVGTSTQGSQSATKRSWTRIFRLCFARHFASSYPAVDELQERWRTQIVVCGDFLGCTIVRVLRHRTYGYADPLGGGIVYLQRRRT
jgi:hypothetical protein